MNPYADFVRDFAALLEGAARLPGPAVPPPPASSPDGGVLILAPHPDDEVIVGALALRLQRELGWPVSAVALTLGSKAERRVPRGEEMRNACAYLGWHALGCPGEEGSPLKPGAAVADPVSWKKRVEALAKVLRERRPRAVFTAHAEDANATHRGAHLLALAGLRAAGPDFKCLVVETEFWGALENPNLMVESSAAETADLVAALSLHAGEVSRNPYHARLPCWMADNVRRGAELLGVQGAAAPRFAFATLYRLSRWDGSTLTPDQNARILASGADLGEIFK